MKINIKVWIAGFKQRVASDGRERRRFFILLLSSIFFLDYIMFCYITQKNVLDIVPALPVLSGKNKIDVYYPDIKGKSVFKEKVEVPQFESKERYAKFLFKVVAEGSSFQNTAIIIPVTPFVRKVWIHDNVSSGKLCVIDLEPMILNNNSIVVSGAEAAFKKAVGETIKSNIPGIKEVLFLERGVPNKSLWEVKI
ncbi:hypothetical protein ACFL20_13430 [Spirochaetota bacterium]